MPTDITPDATTPITTITSTVATAFSSAVGFFPGYYDGDYGYYGGGCSWLYRNAVATGSPYWWNRYQYCVGYYD